METSPIRSTESEEATLRKPTPSRPTLTVPPRNPLDVFSRASDLATTPSPMTFVSSLFADQDPYPDYKSFSQLLAGAMSPTAQPGGNFGAAPADANQGSDARGSDKLPPPPQGGMGINGSPSRSSTARFKSLMPSRLPIPRSPYLTIPPGLSPTTLLDSPVLLSTGQAEPSPTTGTFPLPSFFQDSVAPSSDKFRGISDQDGSPTFVFKPHPQFPMSPLSSMGPFGFSHQQALAQVHAQAQVQLSCSSGGDASVPEPTAVEASPPFTVSNPPSLSEEHAESTPTQLPEASERTSSQLSTQAAFPPAHLIERPSDDGYNWRKYGQKQVKGSEYPRSYYKCTHPNCPVKKKVERSYDGQITEIVYKGEHNHAKPQHTRRSSGMSGGSQMTDRESSHLAAMERGGKGEDLSMLARGRLVPYSAGTPEPSLCSTSDEHEDGDTVKIEDGGEDEPDSKRRRSEKTRESSPNAPLRTIREPRVVVQTMSEVDILDDGYRWRKYGQKQVKGNPYPRSYYKCTNVGCAVRKHVERSSTDSKAVITTYEGKHNHDVPAARNGHHDANGNAASAPPSSIRGISAQRILPKSATSLQEQFLGKYQVAGINAMMHDSLIQEQNMGQGDEGGSSEAGRSTMNPFLNGISSHERSDFLGRSIGLKPKEEPGDVHPLGSSLPPVYRSSSSSFVQQSLML